ncbi:hypothetical protein [Nostoc sp.]|uniref:hypothetical protein n=1 Tax=Nostoc sp. TaxID=1180 RepID=UPI002FF53BE4
MQNKLSAHLRYIYPKLCKLGPELGNFDLGAIAAPKEVGVTLWGFCYTQCVVKPAAWQLLETLHVACFP